MKFPSTFSGCHSEYVGWGKLKECWLVLVVLGPVKEELCWLVLVVLGPVEEELLG